MRRTLGVKVEHSRSRPVPIQDPGLTCQCVTDDERVTSWENFVNVSVLTDELVNLVLVRYVRERQNGEDDF